MAIMKCILLALAGQALATTIPKGGVVSGQRMVISDTATDASITAPGELPTVKLPYGEFRASSYDIERDVYVFTNIPFAKPPTGARRFAKPDTPPNPVRGIQNGTVGNTCAQIMPKYGMNFFGDLAYYGNLGPLVNGILGNMASLLVGGEEDCLYLDVHVPGAFMKNRSAQRVPVVNWIYGGAFLLGSKEMMGVYSGSHLVEMAKGNLIYVAANYRLGVYGWLAGPTVEKEGVVNAGLWDQRAALEWIQDYIHLFGGDKDQVSVWGESAGGSSILHHLTAFGGLQKPLFKRAIALSPAFQPLGDRRPDGMQQKTYQKFERLVGCAGKGLACLRNATKTAIDKANQQIQDEVPPGSFAVGVSVDGTWSRQFPSVDLMQKNVVQGIESVIISHTSAESTIFVDGHITNDTQFDDFITTLFGDLATKTNLTERLNKIYPPVGNGLGKYKNETARVRDFVRDSAFSCNSRYLSQAFPVPKQWYMVYGESGGLHGSDLLALFLRTNMKANGQTIPLTPGIGALSRTYQSYMVSHAITGDPNLQSIKEWSATTVPATLWQKGPRQKGRDIENVLLVENGMFMMGVDVHVPKQNCDFFQDFYVEAQRKAGIKVGPPGTSVEIGKPQW